MYACEADRVSVSVHVCESKCECISMQDGESLCECVCVRERGKRLVVFYTQCKKERECECACQLRGSM